jgi:secreted trypsin-like serine protease
MDIKFLFYIFTFLHVSSTEPIRGRIVGGSKVDSYQFYYQAAIREITTKNFICSGFIINEFYIGTTAFCMMNYLPTQIEALLGTSQISNGGGGWLYRINNIKTHYAFDPAVHLNDVAVIKTNVKISFTIIINSIELASEFLEAAQTVTISGFGKSSHLEEEISENLYFIRKQVITNSDCYSRLYQIGEDPNVVHGNNFCTFNGIGQGTCLGDAGSPVTMNNQIVGIVSWDNFCGLGSPDIHIRISNFRSWFIEKIQEQE